MSIAFVVLFVVFWAMVNILTRYGQFREREIRQRARADAFVEMDELIHHHIASCLCGRVVPCNTCLELARVLGNIQHLAMGRVVTWDSKNIGSESNGCATQH